MEHDMIFEAEYNAVYRYALSLCKNEQEAEDLTQEAFFRALRKKEDFKGNSTLYTYLCAIVKNNYFLSLKKQKKRAELNENIPENEPAVSELVSDKDMTMRIHTALHAMTEPYKEVFSLRIFGELSFGDIANLFGKTESWARVTFYRAKKMILEIIN